MKIDPIKRALELRANLKRDDKVLVVDFSDTLQGKDTSRVIDTMPNIATGEYIFRAKVNVKEIDPVAAKEYGKEFFDIRTKTDNEIENFIKYQEFDFPLWFKHNNGFAMQKVLDYNPPFIVQVGGCNFHDGSATGGCWYCFVDDKSNDGKLSGKTFLGADDHIDSMLAARTKINEFYKPYGFDVNIKVLRMSGGEPTIVLDYILNLWREVGKRGLDFNGQIDSNLSTGYLVDEFEQKGIFEKNTLEKLAKYPIKILTAIKGTDNSNIESNVQSTANLDTQKYSIRKFVKAGFDIYPQMYNPNPVTLENYLTEMDNEIENFSLRTHIGPLKVYGPTTERLTAEAKRLIDNDDSSCISPKVLIGAKADEWNKNYAAATDIMNSYLNKKYGVGYKQLNRSDVQLKPSKGFIF